MGHEVTQWTVGHPPHEDRTTIVGFLYYGARRMSIKINDPLLLHLRMITLAKLRRGEGFALSWKDADSIGDGRSTVWLHPNVDLHFKFEGSRTPTVDRDLLEDLAARANSMHGLELEDATLTAI